MRRATALATQDSSVGSGPGERSATNAIVRRQTTRVMATATSQAFEVASAASA
jgi:hypothetical protein